jgi:hypothetical protein
MLKEGFCRGDAIFLSQQKKRTVHGQLKIPLFEPLRTGMFQTRKNVSFTPELLQTTTNTSYTVE